MRRLLVVVPLVLLLGVPWVVDRGLKPSRPDGGPAALESSVISAAWYCPLTPSLRGVPDAGTIELTNVGDTAVTGVVTFIPEEPVISPVAPTTTMSSTTIAGPLSSAGSSTTTVPSTPSTPSTPSNSPTPTSSSSTTLLPNDAVSVPVTISSTGKVIVRPADHLNVRYAGTVVRLDDAHVTVEHRAVVGGVASVARCANGPSSRWYLADGSSLSATTLALALFNPFPNDAIVDVRFVTSEGRIEPSEFQATFVPANGLVVLPVSEAVRRRTAISTSIDARGGRVIVGQLQTGTVGGVPGTALLAATPEPKKEWEFSDGIVGEGSSDQLALFNPGESEAVVDVRVHVPSAPVPSTTTTVPPDLFDPSSAPEPNEPVDVSFTVHVPADSRITVDLTRESRIPRNRRYVVTLSSSDAIVAGRTAVTGPPAAIRSAVMQ